MWEAVCWRRADWDTPLWALPNTRAGRYNRGGDAGTQYFCLHPWGAWAEVLRWEDRRTVEEAADLTSRLWSIRLRLAQPPVRVTFDEASQHGLRPEDLVAEDHRSCQQLAEQVRAAGATALVVPSAALPGTESLIVFGPRVLLPWAVDAVDPEVDVPGAVTADRAGAPLAVLPHVRWRGTEHTGLTAWRAGSGRPFLEPVPTPLS